MCNTVTTTFQQSKVYTIYSSKLGVLEALALDTGICGIMD